MKKARLTLATLALVSVFAFSLVIAPVAMAQACCPCADAAAGCRAAGHSVETCHELFEACLDILYPL